MAKKKKKQRLTQEQRIAQEYPDGFVVKRYSLLVQMVVLLTSLFLSFIPSFLVVHHWELHNRVVVFLIIATFLFLGIFLAIKIIVATGTTINLKITNAGLEQTKISRSVLVPEKRIVEWKNIKSCRIHLRGLFIRTKKGKNYRLAPYPYRGGELRYGYGDVFDDFLWEFERLAKQHKIQLK